jgi:dihydrofolate reductase
MKAIVCLDKNFGIGRQNKLPWPKNKEDLKFFKEYTWNQAILMGRKTYEGLGMVFLPNRTIYVLNAKLNSCMGCKDSLVYFTSNKDSLLNNLIVCGGREIYDQFLPLCDELMVTHLNNKYECDTFFPYSQIGIDRLFPKKELVKEIGGGKIVKYYK